MDNDVFQKSVGVRIIVHRFDANCYGREYAAGNI